MAEPASAFLLADHTTLRLGGPAAEVRAAATPDEIAAAVDAADATGTPALVLGGGSNLVVADEGFGGTVIALRPPADGAETGGVHVVAQDDTQVTVTVAAGVDWDGFVERAVAEGWSGVEALSGIPGTVGATPVQNVGAYGQEVAQTIAAVRVWDRRLRGERRFTGGECGFGYRSSRFKLDRYDAAGSRHVVTEVSFTLTRSPSSAPIAYAELARTLGVATGEVAPAAEVRAAVLALRASKGMVLDAADHDTWSAGSFFTNPIVEAAQVPDGAPSYPVGGVGSGEGRVKTSAAWLIEHAGFAKGHGTDRVALSSKHTLALTHRGGGTTAELLDLAREVRDGVRQRFAISLENEPVLLGCSL